ALDSRLVRIYTGFEKGAVVGYAFIDVHTVRTLPEAFLVVLTPEGAVRSLRVLAFHEPLEYKPSDRWYLQFEEKSLAEPLRLGGDVHGIVGATLSARATTRGVRKALALYEVVVRNGH
ncbi:MAG TPA: FMN-binding protein, partial [Myxococcota bacterium]